MTRRELETARKACEKYLTFKRAGVPAKTYYRIDAEALELGLDLIAPSLAQSAKLDCDEASSRSGTNGQSTIKGNITTDKAPLPLKAFTDRWLTEYEAANGEAYQFKGGDDAQAAVKALKSGINPDDFFKTARIAWKQTDSKGMWACTSQSRSLRKFWDAWNQIRGEISLMQKRNGQPTTIQPSRQMQSQPGGGSNGRF